MGFFKEYKALRREERERRRRIVVSTQYIIWCAMLGAAAFASFLALIGVQAESKKHTQWLPAEATTRIEKFYFSTELDRVTGKQIPDARGGKDLVVIDFRTADGRECSSFSWRAPHSLKSHPPVPEKLAIVYHADWESKLFESRAEAAAYFGNRSFAFSGGWIASSGKYLAESRYDIQPKLDDAVIRLGDMVVTRDVFASWAISFGVMATFLMVVMFWNRRKAIALVAAEPKAAAESSGLSASA